MLLKVVRGLVVGFVYLHKFPPTLRMTAWRSLLNPAPDPTPIMPRLTGTNIRASVKFIINSCFSTRNFITSRYWYQTYSYWCVFCCYTWGTPTYYNNNHYQVYRG